MPIGRRLAHFIRDITAQEQDDNDPEPHEVEPHRLVDRGYQVDAWLRAPHPEPLTNWRGLVQALNLDERTGNWVIGSYKLVDSPGWIEAPPEKRARILDAAFEFLKKSVSHPANDTTRDVEADAGFKAAVLLESETPTRLLELSVEEWTFWLPLLSEASNWVADREPLNRLVALAYGKFPEEMLGTFASMLQLEVATRFAAMLLDAMDTFWNECVAEMLSTTVAENDLDEMVAENMIAGLLRHDAPRARSLAMQRVGSLEQKPELAIATARSVLVNGDAEAVADLTNEFASNKALLRRTFLIDGPFPDDACFPSSKIPDQEMVKIYFLVADVFPPIQDPEFRTGVQVPFTPRSNAGRLRDRLIRSLAGRSTWSAVEAIENAMSDRPDLHLPAAVFHEAENTVLRSSWRPVRSPHYVLGVVTNEQRGIVHNENQLLDLVLESLGRLQDELIRGGTADLWSEWKIKRRIYYRPKGELAVSDHIKRFLDRDLSRYMVANNREVENIPGNENDILVQAMVPGDEGEDPRRVAIVIEAKGAWNDDLFKDMEAQLADRYLIEHEANHGIYVVGWFRSDDWHSDDPRRKKWASYSLDSLRERLNAQAEAVSNEVRSVKAVVLDASRR